MLTWFWVENGVEIFQFKNSWGTGFGHNKIGKIKRELIFKIHRGVKSYELGLSKSKEKEKDKDGDGNKGNKRSSRGSKLVLPQKAKGTSLVLLLSRAFQLGI